MAWVKRDRGSTPVIRKVPVKQRPLLVEEAVVVGGPAGTVPPLLVHVGGGVRLELTDAGQLILAVQLIQVLQRPC